MESSGTLGSHFIDSSETRERLIEAMGEIDRDIDDFYIPRQAMQELLDGLKFLINIVVVLVPPSILPANRKSR